MTHKRAVPTHRRPVIYQPHQSVLFNAFTVKKNLAFAEKRQLHPKSITLNEVVTWFELDKLLNKKPTELSGGQYQRVLLARTLLSTKPWVLLDEPTLHLDPVQSEKITKILKTIIQQQRQHLIIVTHAFNVAAALGDHFYFFNEGQLKTIAHPNQLVESFKTTNDSITTITSPISILTAKVESHHPELGLSTITLYREDNQATSQTLWVPLRTDKENTQLNLLLQAQDISLSKAKVEDCSILNQVKVSVMNIQKDTQRVIVTCDLDGQTLLTMISLKSLGDLALEVGDQVYACFKARALGDQGS